MLAQCLRSFVGDPRRHLSDTARALDRLLQAVPRELALRRHNVLHRAAAEQSRDAVKVSLDRLLHAPKPLLRYLLEAPQQNSTRLGHGLEVLRGLLGQLLSPLSAEPEELKVTSVNEV